MASGNGFFPSCRTPNWSRKISEISIVSFWRSTLSMSRGDANLFFFVRVDDDDASNPRLLESVDTRENVCMRESMFCDAPEGKHKEGYRPYLIREIGGYKKYHQQQQHPTTIFFSLCRERTVPSRRFCVRVLMLTRTRTRIRTVTREREWEGGALKVGRYMCACVYGRLCERSTPAIDGLLQKVTRFSLNIPFRFRLRVCTRRFRSRLRSK